MSAYGGHAVHDVVSECRGHSRVAPPSHMSACGGHAVHDVEGGQMSRTFACGTAITEQQVVGYRDIKMKVDVLFFS